MNKNRKPKPEGVLFLEWNVFVHFTAVAGWSSDLPGPGQEACIGGGPVLEGKMPACGLACDRSQLCAWVTQHTLHAPLGWKYSF